MRPARARARGPRSRGPGAGVDGSSVHAARTSTRSPGPSRRSVRPARDRLAVLFRGTADHGDHHGRPLHLQRPQLAVTPLTSGRSNSSTLSSAGCRRPTGPDCEAAQQVRRHLSSEVTGGPPERPVAEVDQSAPPAQGAGVEDSGARGDGVVDGLAGRGVAPAAERGVAEDLQRARGPRGRGRRGRTHRRSGRGSRCPARRRSPRKPHQPRRRDLVVRVDGVALVEHPGQLVLRPCRGRVPEPCGRLAGRSSRSGSRAASSR